MVKSSVQEFARPWRGPKRRVRPRTLATAGANSDNDNSPFATRLQTLSDPFYKLLGSKVPQTFMSLARRAASAAHSHHKVLPGPVHEVAKRAPRETHSLYRVRRGCCGKQKDRTQTRPCLDPRTRSRNALQEKRSHCTEFGEVLWKTEDSYTDKEGPAWTRGARNALQEFSQNAPGCTAPRLRQALYRPYIDTI